MQFAGNVLQAVLAACTLRRLSDPPWRVDTLRSMLAVIAVAGVAAPALVSALVVHVYALAGWVPDYASAWRVRFLANAVSTITLAPLLLTVAGHGLRGLQDVTPRRAAEFVAVLAGLLVVDTLVARSATSAAQLALLYAPLPFLLWAAVRFGSPGLCMTLVATLLLFVSQILGGPSVTPVPADNTLTLVVFLVAIAIPLLLLAALITERTRAEEQRNELLHRLGERVKELTALHRAARILQHEQQTTPEWLQQFVAVLPPAWQYPEITAACIRLGELEWATRNFTHTPWTQRADFAVAEGLRGTIEVVYLEERPPEQEGPFLAEERHLIDSLADMLRSALERRQAHEQLSLLQTITMEVGAANDLSSALEVVLRRVCEKTGWVIGQAWIPRHDGMVLDCSPAWFAMATGLEQFRQYSETTTFLPGVLLPGRVWSSQQPAWIQDVTLDTHFLRVQAAGAVGLKAALGIPLLSGEEVLAVMEFFMREPRREDERLVNVITAVAAQLDLVIERKRAEQRLRENDAALRASYARIQELAGKLITAQEAERARIARELHDDVNQQLASVSIALSNVKRRLHDGGNTTVQEELTRLQQHTIDLAEVIRSLSHALHPGVLHHAGLVAALQGHCAEFGRQHAIEVTLSAADGLDGIPHDVALCLYRVAQEALHNTAAHAGARQVHVTLRGTADGLELVIADDGQGFNLAQAQHQGGLALISLDERVRLVGGSLTIHTQVKRGTEVRVQVPWRGMR